MEPGGLRRSSQQPMRDRDNIDVSDPAPQDTAGQLGQNPGKPPLRRVLHDYTRGDQGQHGGYGPTARPSKLLENLAWCDERRLDF